MKKRYLIYASVKDRKEVLIGVGSNSYKKTHPLQKFFAERVGKPQNIYIHAEILAMIRASGSPLKQMYTLTVGRWDNSTPQDAKPCEICVEAAIFFGIKKINYTTKNGWVYGKTPQELKDEYSKSK